MREKASDSETGDRASEGGMGLKWEQNEQI